MRLVDADRELKQMLECDWNVEKLDLRQRLININRSQPTVNKWIPCEERLPEKEGQYLAYCRGYHSNYYEVCSFSKDLSKVDIFEFEKNEFGFYNEDLEFGAYRLDVLAWMPLPEPFKTEFSEAEQNQ